MISSFCHATGCVQVDPAPDGGVYVRRAGEDDVKLPFTAAEFRAFIAGVKAGEFDDLILAEYPCERCGLLRPHEPHTWQLIRDQSQPVPRDQWDRRCDGSAKDVERIHGEAST